MEGNFPVPIMRREVKVRSAMIRGSFCVWVVMVGCYQMMVVGDNGGGFWRDGYGRGNMGVVWTVGDRGA